LKRLSVSEKSRSNERKTAKPPLDAPTVERRFFSCAKTFRKFREIFKKSGVFGKPFRAVVRLGIDGAFGVNVGARFLDSKAKRREKR